MGRAAPPAATARGEHGNGNGVVHGVVDLTPPVPAATTTAAGHGRRAEKDHEKAPATTGMRTPVPLWKARDILLEAVSGESAGFFEAHSSLSSRRRRRGRASPPAGRGDGTPITGGVGNGHSDGADRGDDDERVFSVRLEVCAAGAGAEGPACWQN